MKILLIEDDREISGFLQMELMHEGYAVQAVADGDAGLEAAMNGTADLILLDVMLPGLSGLEVLRRLRTHRDTPVILLTARDAVADKVAGLDMGAEDYITKPFEIEELLARIRACLRKAGRRAAPAHIWRAGALALDADRHAVTYDGNAVELTHREFTLLQILLENKGIVMTRSALLERVWGYDYMGETNIVDVYIRYLRSKIDDVYHVKLLHTVRGVGYVLRDKG